MLFVGLLACGSAESPLVADPLQALETAMREAAAAGRDQTCERPVLRGTPTPGPADDDAVAVVSSPTPGDAVRAAVAHTDACSPFGLGRRPVPDDVLAWTKIAPAVRSEAEALPADEGLRLVLDTIRFGQDLGRGPAPLMPAMIGASMAQELAPLAHRLLDSPGLNAAGFVAELDALHASAVHPHPILAAEGHLITSRILPVVIGDGYVAPDGLPAIGMPPASPSLTGDPRRDSTLALLGAADVAASWLEACPVDAEPEDCATRLKALAERMQRERGQLAGDFEGMAPPIDAAPGSDLERSVQKMLGGTVAIAGAVAADLPEATARVAALRLHLQARVSSTCPQAPVDGSLDVRPVAGGVELWAPPYLTKLRKPLATVTCD